VNIPSEDSAKANARPKTRVNAMRLFSYVVHHDTGFAPNPHHGFCTLVHCKRKTKKRNIVELAEEGDWIIGTGGKNKKLSCGRNDCIIYIMRVDEKLPFAQFLRDRRFHGRADCKDLGHGNEYALISETFLYFGRDAISVSRMPATALLDHPIEKKGPGFRTDFSDIFIRRVARWVQNQRQLGKVGEPCAPPPANVSGRKCHPRKQPRSGAC
jgi:hypothetical protein